MFSLGALGRGNDEPHSLRQVAEYEGVDSPDEKSPSYAPPTFT